MLWIRTQVILLLILPLLRGILRRYFPELLLPPCLNTQLRQFAHHFHYLKGTGLTSVDCRDGRTTDVDFGLDLDFWWWSCTRTRSPLTLETWPPQELLLLTMFDVELVQVHDIRNQLMFVTFDFSNDKVWDIMTNLWSPQGISEGWNSLLQIRVRGQCEYSRPLGYFDSFETYSQTTEC